MRLRRGCSFGIWSLVLGPCPVGVGLRQGRRSSPHPRGQPVNPVWSSLYVTAVTPVGGGGLDALRGTIRGGVQSRAPHKISFRLVLVSQTSVEPLSLPALIHTSWRMGCSLSLSAAPFAMRFGRSRVFRDSGHESNATNEVAEPYAAVNCSARDGGCSSSPHPLTSDHLRQRSCRSSQASLARSEK